MRTNPGTRMVIVLSACIISANLTAQNITIEKALTNKDIVSMVGSGLNHEIVKAAIEKSKTNFDLSATAIIQLKKSGTPDDIVLAMISRMRTATAIAPEDSFHLMTSGIYYRSKKGYRPVEGHVLIGEHSKGAFGRLKKTFGSLLNLTMVAKITGDHSPTTLEEPKPELIFILDYPVRSASDFFLVKLQVKGNSRQFNFQKISDANGLIAVNDTLKIAFISRKMEDGIYQVTPAHPLRRGEYCFLYNSSALYKGSNFMAFDFKIDTPTEGSD